MFKIERQLLPGKLMSSSFLDQESVDRDAQNKLKIEQDIRNRLHLKSIFVFV